MVRVKGADTTGQSAMVIVEPSTGYVVAEVGGLGENEDTLGINRATSKRQGGSAFKTTWSCSTSSRKWSSYTINNIL